jgi:hypothetical protein
MTIPELATLALLMPLSFATLLETKKPVQRKIFKRT